MKARSAVQYDTSGGAMSGRRNPALDLRHPFFLPKWRRVAVIAALAFWTWVEITQGNPFWAMLVGGIGIYAIYVFFFDFVLPDDEH
ncbi:MAG: hypothetical protein ACI9KS_001399 [Sulfitobacter sp.]